jgi:macrolide transport system ATP-binding/permease protein
VGFAELAAFFISNDPGGSRSRKDQTMSSLMALHVIGVAKSFGTEVVLRDASFVLNAGEKVGLVGENGVGKSTLLRIIAGQIVPDAGRVFIAPDITVGYLSQEVPLVPGQTIAELLASCHPRLAEAAERLRRLESELALASASADDRTLAEYGEAVEAFERLGGYDRDRRIREVLDGLGLAGLSDDREVATLSGGEKRRLALAALLLISPDVLLLDEPTNHLDFAALGWLESYIVAHQGAMIAISHDRRFLNATVQNVLELPAHSRELKEYPGNYDAFLAAKQRERRQWEEDYERQQEEIAELRATLRTSAHQVGHNRARSDNDKFSKGFFAGRAQVAISRNVRAAEERLRRIEAAAIPKPPEQLRISPRFEPRATESAVPLRGSGIGKSYRGQSVLTDVDLVLRTDSRVVLIGPNGTGKTTLLKILAGLTTPDRGSVQCAPGVTVGYLDQEQESLDEDQTVLAAYREGLIGYEDDLTADVIRYGLFGVDDLTKTLAQLSVGQKRKLQLARLVATRANVLLLDEPTNHIHFDILEELEKALEAFAGPIVAVSHDRWFIDRFAREVWELRDGKLTPQ